MSRSTKLMRWRAPWLLEFEQYIKLNKKVPPEVLVSVNQIDDASKLADTVASTLDP